MEPNGNNYKVVVEPQPEPNQIEDPQLEPNWFELEKLQPEAAGEDPATVMMK